MDTKRDDAMVARVAQQDRVTAAQAEADRQAQRAAERSRSDAERSADEPRSMERSGPDVTAEAQAEATKAEAERNAAAAREAAGPPKMDRRGFAKLDECTTMMKAKTDELVVLVRRVVDVVNDIERDRERR